jgi:hypothetical protein
MQTLHAPDPSGLDASWFESEVQQLVSSQKRNSNANLPKT